MFYLFSSKCTARAVCTKSPWFWGPSTLGEWQAQILAMTFFRWNTILGQISFSKTDNESSSPVLQKRIEGWAVSHFWWKWLRRADFILCFRLCYTCSTLNTIIGRCWCASLMHLSFKFFFKNFVQVKVLLLAKIRFCKPGWFKVLYFAKIKLFLALWGTLVQISMPKKLGNLKCME